MTRRGLSHRNGGHARSQGVHDVSASDRCVNSVLSRYALKRVVSSIFCIHSVYDTPSRGMHGDGRHSPPQLITNKQDLGAVMQGRDLRAQMQQRDMYQMSQSLTDYANQLGQTTRFAGDNSSITGQVPGSHPYSAGPQSYNEAGYGGAIQGSFNQNDFVYALQRPGVVPMGESLPSVDLSAGPILHQHHQQHSVGSHGTGHRGVQHRGNSAYDLTSRSFGDSYVDSTLSDPHGHSLGTSANSLGQHLPVGSQGSFGGQMNVTTHGMVHSLENPMLQQMANAPHPQMADGSVHGGSMPGDFPQLPYGNAQAYLQQQRAALQQQAALLQQQQAALALQQQQLQAYGINPALFNSNPSNSNFSGANQQFGQTGGGYYYVSSVDGTQMTIPGQVFPQQSLPAGYDMNSQYQNVGNYQNNFDDSGGGGQGFHPPNDNNYRGMSM